ATSILSMNQRLPLSSNTVKLLPHSTSQSWILLLQQVTCLSGYQTGLCVTETLRRQGLITTCSGLRFYTMELQLYLAPQRHATTGRLPTGNSLIEPSKHKPTNTTDDGNTSWLPNTSPPASTAPPN